MVKFILYKYGVESAHFAPYFGPLAVACRSRKDRPLPVVSALTPDGGAMSKNNSGKEDV